MFFNPTTSCILPGCCLAFIFACMYLFIAAELHVPIEQINEHPGVSASCSTVMGEHGSEGIAGCGPASLIGNGMPAAARRVLKPQQAGLLKNNV